VKAVVPQCDIYVVDDASNDDTATIAREAGAHVHRMHENVGKARAIRHMLDENVAHLGDKKIVDVYEYILILDDDTVIDDDHIDTMEKMMDENPHLACGEGLLESKWGNNLNWNGYIAARAFACWRVQFIISRIQSMLQARTWINGTLTIYRSHILDSVVRHETKFVTEDTDWLWQIHRRHLGAIRFNRKARAHLQEPQTWRELYRQHVRWNWGLFQVARAHKIGLRISRPDVMWVCLAFVAVHFLFWPIYALFAFSYSSGSIYHGLAWFLLRYIALSFISAAVSRQWRHIFMWPFFLAYDLNWRVAVIHGFLKAVFKPTVNDTTWVSPARYRRKAA